MRKYIFSIPSACILGLALLVPAIALAQTIGGKATPSNFSEIVCIFVVLVLDFIPYVVVIAVGAFLAGLIKYVGHGENEEKRAEGTKMMIYGVFGFFFIVSIWGIIFVFVNSFRMPFGVPQLKTTSVTGGYGANATFKQNCTAFTQEANRLPDTD